MVLELKGDIRDTPIKNIAHGVNCQGVMGSGVAKALFEKWPEVRNQYISYCKERFHPEVGEKPEDLLGAVLEIYEEKRIFNMFTQLDYRKDQYNTDVYVDYAALLLCFNATCNILNQYEKTKALAVPKIGAGLAGGDWNIIKNIMVETTQKKGIDLVIYTLK